MKVISLDQCFLRALLRPPPNAKAAFGRLHTALLNAIEAEKLLCPAHVEETVYESVVLPASDRNAIVSLQNELAAGVCFQSFYNLLAAESLKIARPELQPEVLRFGYISIPSDVDLNTLAEGFRCFKKEAVLQASGMKYPPTSYQEGDDLKAIHQHISEERCGSMFRIVEAIALNGSIETGKSEWEGAVHVGEFLLSKRVTAAECRTIRDAIINRQWEKIPVYFNHTVLFAKIERDGIETGRKFTMNDHPDVLRVSVALQFAHAIGCDTYIKETVKQIGLELDQPNMIFSPREADRLADWVELL